MRLYSLLGHGPALIDVAPHGDRWPDLPLSTTIPIGGGDGYDDPGGALRAVLGADSGGILIRPDLHVAWARTDATGAVHAARHALGFRTVRDLVGTSELPMTSGRRQHRPAAPEGGGQRLTARTAWS